MKLSASSIGAFKACPTRFRNAYHYGIRAIEDTESQRVGNIYHDAQEINGLKPGGPCLCLNKKDDFKCYVCDGSGVIPDDFDMMTILVDRLNQLYANIEFNNPIDRDIERMILLYTIIGYNWYYGEQDEKVLVNELKFEIPLINPKNKNVILDTPIVGKIDKIIRLSDGTLAIKEHKSTTKSVDPDSTFWGRLNLDTQTTLYVHAARYLQLTGKLEEFGIKPDEPLISKIKYDAWHRPGIGPSKLTQKASKEFVETGKYMDQEFEVRDLGQLSSMPIHPVFAIGDTNIMVEPGKKEGTFAIYETPEMFAARYLKDITERPEFYFRCVNLSRIDSDMESFKRELYNIYKDMQRKIITNGWWVNEQQCEATFRCDFINECYNHITIDPEHIPDGMKCIFKKEEDKNG